MKNILIISSIFFLNNNYAKEIQSELISKVFVNTVDDSSDYYQGKCFKKVKGSEVTSFEEKISDGKCEKLPMGKIIYGTREDWKYHTTGGFPVPRWGNKDLTRIIYKNYVVAYSNKYKLPLWVMSNQDKRSSKIEITGRGADKFSCDPGLPSHLSTFQETFNNDSGSSFYHRGHLYPNGLGRTCKERVSTFLTTNIVPQVGSKFNAKVWKDLEECVRKRTEKENKLSIISGVIFPKKGKTCNFPDNPKYKNKLKSGLVVPCKFYKIIMDKENKKYEAYLFDNIEYDKKSNDVLKENSTTITNISNITGLRFFPNIKNKYKSGLICE